MASLATLPADAEKILNLFAAQLTSQGVELPERQYVQPGSMAVWDGEQMTAGLMGIMQGEPGLAMAQTFVPGSAHYHAQFFVILIRQIAVMNTESFETLEIPTAAQQDSDGQASMGDSAALLIAGEAIHRAPIGATPGAPTSPALTGSGEGYVIDGLQPLGPEGALAGNRLLLSISLS